MIALSDIHISAWKEPLLAGKAPYHVYSFTYYIITMTFLIPKLLYLLLHSPAMPE